MDPFETVNRLPNHQSQSPAYDVLPLGQEYDLNRPRAPVYEDDDERNEEINDPALGLSRVPAPAYEDANDHNTESDTVNPFISVDDVKTVLREIWSEQNELHEFIQQLTKTEKLIVGMEDRFQQKLDAVLAAIEGNKQWDERDVNHGKMFFDGHNKTVGFHGPKHWIHVRKVDPHWLIESEMPYVGHAVNKSSAIANHDPPILNGKTVLEAIHSILA